MNIFVVLDLLLAVVVVLFLYKEKGSISVDYEKMKKPFVEWLVIILLLANMVLFFIVSNSIHFNVLENYFFVASIIILLCLMSYFEYLRAIKLNPDNPLSTPGFTYRLIKFFTAGVGVVLFALMK